MNSKALLLALVTLTILEFGAANAVAGVQENGVNLNGVNLNGVNLNGVNLNGLPFDGIMSSALQSTSVTEDGAIEGELAEVLLQYIYSCAMPAGESMHVVLDDGGDDSLRAVDLVLEGTIGLAPEWGEEGGACDEACQRWISACLLARSNALGLSVEISMRGPHPALAVSAPEADEFPLFEGAFYGNLFASEPALRGCTGPASSLAALTDRLCAMTAGSCPVEVYTDCRIEPTACTTQYHSCESSDANGAVLGCRDEAFRCDGAPNPAAVRYGEVITVYLREPLASCGNGVCEVGERVECADDCGGWARRFGGHADDEPTAGVATDAAGNVISAGYFTGTVDFGDESSIGASDTTDLFVWKQAPDGSVLWVSPFDAERAAIRSVVVDSSGDLFVGGWFEATLALGDELHLAQRRDGFVAKLGAGGDVMWSRTFAGSGDATVTGIAATPTGGVAATGFFRGPMAVGGTSLESAGCDDLFVVVFDADGTLEVARRFGERASSEWGMAIASDGAGNLFVGGRFPGRLPLGGKHTLSALSGWDAFLFSLDAAGELRWSRMITGTSVAGSAESIEALATDSAGNVIAGGTGDGIVDFGGESVGELDSFAAKYSSNGALLWVSPIAGSWKNTITAVAVDEADHVLVAGEVAGASVVGGIPVDGGLFGDALAAKLRPDTGAPVWVERYGAGAADRATGIAANATGDIVVAGSFRGTALLRNHFVTSPGGNGSMATEDGFVLRFSDPVPSEVIADPDPPPSDGGNGSGKGGRK